MVMSVISSVFAVFFFFGSIYWNIVIVSRANYIDNVRKETGTYTHCLIIVSGLSRYIYCLRVGVGGMLVLFKLNIKITHSYPFSIYNLRIVSLMLMIVLCLNEFVLTDYLLTSYNIYLASFYVF